MRARMVLSFCLFAGCGSEKVWSPLIESTAWAPTSVAADPLSSHRPEVEACSPVAWRVELGGLEVDTGECNYLSLSQPARFAISGGAEIRLIAWWQTLASVEPAFGHLAIFAGDTALFDEHIPIPGPAEARDVVLTAPRDFPEGTAITFHLHNHGSNTWNLENVLALQEGN